MSPRPGGEADKFGNRYEGKWTVQHLLRVLAGEAEAIAVEEVGTIGEGAEFTFYGRDGVQVHQLKRQNRQASTWTVRSLNDKGIWAQAKLHIEAGHQYHFVSTLPAQPIRELGDRARESADFATFKEHYITKANQEPFDQLSGILGSPEVAWKVLRGFWVQWPDEQNITGVNASLSELLIEGADGRLVAAGLGDLVLDNLGVRLEAAVIESKLKTYSLRKKNLLQDQHVAARVADITAGWVEGIERELLHPAIPRDETEKLFQLLADSSQLIFLSGNAGGGKSAALHQVAQQTSIDHIPLLGFRLDWLEPFHSTAELGSRLGLDVSPVTALAAVAAGRQALLVVDQLDAVSLASGRMPESFYAVANLLREAAAYPNVRVLLACRKFDIDNDYRIKALVDASGSETVELGSLTEAQVTDAVRAMSLDPAALSSDQLKLLRTPLQLVLLSRIAGDAGAISFRTPKNLFDKYWERKRRDCAQRREGLGDRFGAVLGFLAEALSNRQRLSVDETIFDETGFAGDVDVLISDQVFSQYGTQIAFFHEQFFAYVFARTWINKGQTLSEFLTAGEQELFRRSQVRQILEHMRESDPNRLIAEVEELLKNTKVRFHVKDVVLGFIRSMPEPSAAEWDMVERLLGEQLSFEERLWLSLRSTPWFERLDDEGIIEEWLAGEDQQMYNHALNVMMIAAKDRPDRLAEILEGHRRHPRYGESLLWIVRFADIHNSRQLFVLLTEAIRSGRLGSYGHNVWVFTYNLAQHQPAWAVELLTAHLLDRPGALAVDSSGKVEALSDKDDALNRLVTQAAEGAPKEFCEALVPYMLRVMQLTEYQNADHLLYDKHFHYRIYGAHSPRSQLDSTLLTASATALREFVGKQPTDAKPLLDTLAADGHDAAQWLLYEGIRGDAARTFADWISERLAEDRTRLLSGYMSNGVWATRELIEAVGPYLSAEAFSNLERAILELRFPWEGYNKAPWGLYTFCLLSALEESRLSVLGEKRLAELRRRFGIDRPQISAPFGFRSVPSPIPGNAAEHMRDADWLRAIAKHDHEAGPFSHGGADELGGVLQAETTKDPARFARLSLQFDATVNRAYLQAILIGLGESDVDALDDCSVIFDAMRHLATLPQRGIGHILTNPLRRHSKRNVPDEIVRLLIDRVLNAAPSSDDVLQQDRPDEQDRGSWGDIIYSEGINSPRGSAAIALGDILVYDSDGHTTALVVPALTQMIAEPSVVVRGCVAHVVAACLQYARPQATEAFEKLIEGDDRILAVHTVERLANYLGNGDPTLVTPVIERMLASEFADVREAGGRMAARAGLEWDGPALLAEATASPDLHTRRGVAMICAHWLPDTTNAAGAMDALSTLMNDEHVQSVVAEVAGELRGKKLYPFRIILEELMSSGAFAKALPQLLITLEQAPDRIDDLVVACARRFIEVHGGQLNDFSTGASADARSVGQLVLRGYAQASGVRLRQTLDLIDQLLELNAYGVADLVDGAER